MNSKSKFRKRKFVSFVKKRHKFLSNYAKNSRIARKRRAILKIRRKSNLVSSSIYFLGFL